MKKLILPLFCFMFLFGGCKEKPVTQVYLPVSSEQNSESAASKSADSVPVSDSASRGQVSSRPASASSVDTGKAEETKRKELLQEKKKEKKALELVYQRLKSALNSDISSVKSKIKDCEAQLDEVSAVLWQLEDTLEKVWQIPDGSERVEEELKQKIEAAKEQIRPLQGELEELTLEKDVLEQQLTALQQKYDDAIFKVSVEILALS